MVEVKTTQEIGCPLSGLRIYQEAGSAIPKFGCGAGLKQLSVFRGKSLSITTAEDAISQQKE